jgi:hypothetical protein
MDVGGSMIFCVDDDFKWANNKVRRYNCIIHTLHIYVKFVTLENKL